MDTFDIYFSGLSLHWIAPVSYTIYYVNIVSLISLSFSRFWTYQQVILLHFGDVDHFPLHFNHLWTFGLDDYHDGLSAGILPQFCAFVVVDDACGYAFVP